MSLHLHLLLAGCFCRSFAGIPQVIVQQNAMATLPCAREEGDVSWSRYINGKKVTLVTIEKGTETEKSARFSSQADNSLVIMRVTPSDAAMYWCDGSKVYLEVTTDPNVEAPSAGLGFSPGPGPGQKGVPSAGGADTEDQQASDFWVVPVGVVVGAALVLLAVFTLRFCSGKRSGTNSDSDKAADEVIYEEIRAGGQQPRRDSDVESPYYWTPIRETPSTSTPPSDNLYSTVKLKTAARRREECVYYLAQNPPQTGNVND